MSICIVGAGVSGLLLLIALEKANVSPSKITIIDPYFDGGDLKRLYSNVISNTIWKQTYEAIGKEYINNIDENSTTELNTVIDYIMYSAKSYLNKCNMIIGYVNKSTYNEDKWCTHLKNTSTIIKSDILILTTGSDPKTLDLPIPIIPLEVALDKTRLSKYILPTDHIILFGTQHSGTLCIDNISKLANKVTAIYKGDKPFLFARDGVYDGIKQDSAIIADRILTNNYSNVELYSLNDISNVVKVTRKADKVVYAIGFNARNDLELNEYDDKTGKIKNVKNAWGFGIAYPSRSEGGLDAGVSPFMEHIQKQLPEIISFIQ